MRAPSLVAGALLLSGCASPVIAAQANTIYQGTTDATQYRSPNPHDVKGAVAARPVASGTTCRTMLTFPSAPPGVFLGSNTVMQILPWNALAIVFGDDGFASAVARAREGGARGHARRRPRRPAHDGGPRHMEARVCGGARLARALTVSRFLELTVGRLTRARQYLRENTRNRSWYSA